MHFLDIIPQGLESESKFSVCTKDLLSMFGPTRCCIISLSQNVSILFIFSFFFFLQTRLVNLKRPALVMEKKIYCLFCGNWCLDDFKNAARCLKAALRVRVFDIGGSRQQYVSSLLRFSWRVTRIWRRARTSSNKCFMAPKTRRLLYPPGTQGDKAGAGRSKKYMEKPLPTFLNVYHCKKEGKAFG